MLPIESDRSSPKATITGVGADILDRHSGNHFTSSGQSEGLGERELFLLVTLSALLVIATASMLGDWSRLILRAGDNAAYAEVATAIQHWNFRGVHLQHFMGYPYFIAAISLLLHVRVMVGLWLVACIASFAAVFLTARLFGTWTAAYFALSNFAWLQLSFLGGSEPLAVALGLGAFWMFRRQRIIPAALLASLAATVRPLMFFALLGIGVVLMYRKQVRDFLIALGIGLSVGTLYVLPLTIYFGDPLYTLHTYTSRDYGAAKLVGPHGRLFGWPFHGIVAGTMTYPAPWTNLALSFSWISLVLVGTAMMFSRRFREYLRTYPNEGIYCGLYLLAIFCYDYLVWARSNFIRFSIPILPFVFFAILRWLPKDRRVLWTLGIVSPVLAACSAIGIRNVLQLH
jgi:hypothetical protein